METTIDLGSMAGVVAATWILVALLGKVSGPTAWAAAFGQFIAANQQLAALGVAALLAVLSKLAGIGFVESGWLALALQAIGSALTAGLVQDKIAKPVTQVTSAKGTGNGTDVR